MYPQIAIDRNLNPNRLYAIPLLGFLIKIIILIPVFLEVWLLSIVTGIIVILINPFAVLFTGKYLKLSYDLATGVMRLGIKISFYLTGVTDQYPGFSIGTTPFTWDLAYPESSSRLFAIPILGFLIRFILIIPYSIFNQVVSTGSVVAAFVIITPLSVLIKGYYPETTHEIIVDSNRLNNASMAYMYGLSDKYPSFNISWHHKTLKIILIIIGALIMLANFGSGFIPQKPTNPSTPSTLESQV